MIEKISAVTLRVTDMQSSVRFYKDVLGFEIIYGGESSSFTSLRSKEGTPILNLEEGDTSIRWGRLIFQVSDVDSIWATLQKEALARTGRRMLLGVSVTFTCSILMATNYPLPVQFKAS